MVIDQSFFAKDTEITFWDMANNIPAEYEEAYNYLVSSLNKGQKDAYANTLALLKQIPPKKSCLKFSSVAIFSELEMKKDWRTLHIDYFEAETLFLALAHFRSLDQTVLHQVKYALDEIIHTYAASVKESTNVMHQRIRVNYIFINLMKELTNLEEKNKLEANVVRQLKLLVHVYSGLNFDKKYFY